MKPSGTSSARKIATASNFSPKLGTIQKRGNGSQPYSGHAAGSAKVLAHRHGAGTAGAAQPGHTPGILDRPQEAVVGLRDARLKSCPSYRRDHQRDNPSTGGVRAASGIGAPFVPGDEENAAVTERRRVQDGGNLLAEPAISGCDRTIVHVVAHVGRDPGVTRD